jgi:D-alanyl-D-alanine carboxypeptidase (penicillin-binding protein 5/6)
LPKAYVLVDADTGAVLAQQDAHTKRPPASTIKLMTALIAMQRLRPGDGIPISPAAEGMPARKINVKAGQTWVFEDLLRSMMMVSANDAAVAIAERIGGGSLEGFIRVAQATAVRLHLADDPVLNDPAGLDDEFSNKGGARISPRDLAIISRAVLAEPDLMKIINTRDYAFTGGDGLGHTLSNHDLFLDMYPGANGLKTGTTELAGHTFVGSATRGGRTMLAIVFDAVDYYGSAAALLDQGFNTPVNAQANLEHLPDVTPDAAFPPRRPANVMGTPAAPVGAARRGGGGGLSFLNSPFVAVLLFIVGLVPLIALRRRTVVRNQHARAAARRAARTRAGVYSDGDLDGIPDEAGVFVSLEEELGRVMFVDVADQPVVDAVADELA